jgi:hypothetical protein
MSGAVSTIENLSARDTTNGFAQGCGATDDKDVQAF